MSAARLPTFDEIVPAHSVRVISPSVLKALHRSRREIRELGGNAVNYYKALEVNSVLLSRRLPPRGHVDGGALATTTDRKDYLWHYHSYTAAERAKSPRLKVADDTIHRPEGYGYIKVPCDSKPGYLFVLTYHTPAIPATIVSPDDMCRALQCKGYQTFSDIVDNRASLQLTDCQSCDGSMDFSLQVIRGLLYTDSLILPLPDQRLDTGPPSHPTCDVTSWNGVNTTTAVRALTQDQQRMLWHMRLGHVHHRAVADAHEYVKGIPKLPRADLLHDCPICKRTKLHKAARGDTEEIESEECWQHINIDFGFIVQKSSESSKGAKSPSKTRPRKARKRLMTPQELQMRTLRRSQRLQSQSRSPSTPIVETVPEDTDSDVDHDAPTPPRRRRTRRPRSNTVLPSPVDDQKYTFDSIMTHEGPLDRTHKRWKGAPYNLKIKWSTGETSWEPLHRVFEDVPSHVVDYARKKNLLGNQDWTRVRDHALASDHDDTPAIAEFDEEFESPEYARVHVPHVAHAETGLSARYKRLVGINGETCYCIITDRKSGSWKLAICRDKAPPIDFIRSFISNYKPSVSNCTVRVDGGGELGGNTEIHEIFEKAGYEVEVTPPDTSSANGQAERPHRTIADGIRTMLHAANLPLKFWPYALRYFVLIHNMLRHGGRDKSCIEICTGEPGDARFLRIFGCRIYALPAKDRESKLDVPAREGIFLGYRKSLRDAYYFDLETQTVKTSRHVAFDEALLESKDPPPFAHYLRNATLPADALDLGEYESLSSIPTPFTKIVEIDCALHPDSEHPLGFQVGRDPRFLRAFATSFNRAFGHHTKEQANRKFLGSYVLKIGDYPVFSQDDIAEVLHQYCRMPSPP